MRHIVIFALLYLCPLNVVMAEYDTLIIDDRSSGSRVATSGGEWRLITDRVMGGISDGQLSADVAGSQGCLRLQGNVTLENNGGFVQAALDVNRDVLGAVHEYAGLVLVVQGNSEQYNVHLRTSDNSLPWQSYRAAFTATPEWKRVYLPFSAFEPYRTGKALDVRRLKRIGIVAIGREFRADLCIGEVGLFK
ncbi:CIA30 family protein [Pseudomonadota bacterium]